MKNKSYNFLKVEEPRNGPWSRDMQNYTKTKQGIRLQDTQNYTEAVKLARL